MSYLPYAIAAWLFLVGLYGVISSRNLVHLNHLRQRYPIIELCAVAGNWLPDRGNSPIFVDVPVGTPAVDPVVQALMLTDVVVEVTVVALLLALAIQVHKRHGTLNPDELRKLKG